MIDTHSARLAKEAPARRLYNEKPNWLSGLTLHQLLGLRCAWEIHVSDTEAMQLRATQKISEIDRAIERL